MPDIVRRAPDSFFSATPEPPPPPGVSHAEGRAYNHVMAFRAFLAFWFFATSVCAPTYCCCLPPTLHSTDRAGTVPMSAPAAVSAKKSCPHCHPPADPKAEGPKEKGNPHCPGGPARERCPCQDRMFASAVLNPPELRTTILATWLSDVAASVTTLFDFDTLCGGDTPLLPYTGPPPPAGVELLRHLHILIC